jgi:hypothetical protein
MQTQNESKTGDVAPDQTYAVHNRRSTTHITVLIAQIEDVRLRRNPILQHSTATIAGLSLGTPQATPQTEASAHRDP